MEGQNTTSTALQTHPSEPPPAYTPLSQLHATQDPDTDHPNLYNNGYTTKPYNTNEADEREQPDADGADESDEVDEFEDSDSDEDPDPITLVLDAETRITGDGNHFPLTSISPTSPSSTVLGDATRFSTLLLAAIHRLNSEAERAAVDVSATAAKSGIVRLRPVLQVHLNIRAGVTIHGNRNVLVSRETIRPVDGRLASLKRKVEDEHRRGTKRACSVE